MKTTLRIAWLEMALLFYSPIAWVLLFIFIIQNGMSYSDLIRDYTHSGLLWGHLNNLTTRIFSDTQTGFYPGVLSTIYLYMPLLTMGMISRELSSGSIKLLYSSPVKVHQIVLGKYLALLGYCLALLLALSCFAICGALTIRTVNTGVLISGLIAFWLLLCTYAAIGLFMSSLTAYQVVAAISTFAIFALLNYIGNLWQDVGFGRDLTKFLSISGRSTTMLNGLIISRDIVYFLVITGLFLSFCILYLRGKRETAPWYVKSWRYAVVAFLAFIIAYGSTFPRLTAYFDLTANQTNTLAESSQQILKSISGQLQVTTYVNFLDNTYLSETPAKRNDDLARWEFYTRFMPEIKFKYVYYYDSIPDPNFYKGETLKQHAERRAMAWNASLDHILLPAQIRKIIDLGPENRRLVMQLTYNGRSTFLRTFDDIWIWPGEEEVDAALKRLTTQLPVIAFASGNYERAINVEGDLSYQLLANDKLYRAGLVNQGFNTVSIDLMSQAIPDSIAALVIADPKSAFDPQELAKISQFIGRGGNLILAGEPGKQATINPIIAPLGVQLDDGELVQKSNDFDMGMVKALPTAVAQSYSVAMQNAAIDSMQVTMPGAAALSFTTSKRFNVQVLLQSDPVNGWKTSKPMVADSAQIVYSKTDGDQKGAFPTALALTRLVGGKTQHIFIAGDADFMSNRELSTRSENKYCNYIFIESLLRQVTDGRFPVEVTRPADQDRHLLTTNESALMIKVLFIGVIPLVLVITATILLIRRRRN